MVKKAKGYIQLNSVFLNEIINLVSDLQAKLDEAFPREDGKATYHITVGDDLEAFDDDGNFAVLSKLGHTDFDLKNRVYKAVSKHSSLNSLNSAVFDLLLAAKEKNN